MMGTNHEAPNIAVFSSLISFCPSQVQVPSSANNSQHAKPILFPESFTSTKSGQNKSQEMWDMFPIPIMFLSSETRWNINTLGFIHIKTQPFKYLIVHNYAE